MNSKELHLDFIQRIISRLASNSFKIKGWAILFATAALAFSEPGRDMSYMIVSYVPLGMLWGLDGYFLWQERSFRTLYDNVRQRPGETTDYELTLCGSKNSWIDAVFSRTLLAFYGTLIAVITVVVVGGVIWPVVSG